MSLDFTIIKAIKCPYCHHDVGTGNEVFSANITHNLATMADKAGIYEALWRSEELDITKAEQLIEILEGGLERLKGNPTYYRRFNSENGWGSYKHFVPFVEKVLEACKEYPKGKVETDV